jgi:hypothetical protein
MQLRFPYQRDSLNEAPTGMTTPLQKRSRTTIPANRAEALKLPDQLLVRYFRGDELNLIRGHN